MKFRLTNWLFHSWILSTTNITSSGVTQKLAQYEGTFYYMKDSQGTVTSLLDPSGGVVQKYNYRSYGKLINIKNGSGQDISPNPVLRSSFTYIGREYEDETGLFYMRARYYDPSTGRFMQKDPIPGDIRVPQTVINQFIYAGNNPVMFTDPSGAFIAALIGLIYEAIAAAISAIYTYIANLMSAIMTADWKGIYDGITSFAGLKDQALGAGKESFVGAFKNYVGLPDLREVMGQFNFNPVPSGLDSIPGAKYAGNAGFDFGIFGNRAGPKYGNFCGGGWTGGANGKENPVDDLDVCCYHNELPVQYLCLDF